MDKDRVEGSAKQVKGAVKETIGKVVGDSKLAAEGKADKAEGKMQNAIGGLKDALREAVKKYMHEHHSYHYPADSDFRRRRRILCARSLWNCGARRRPRDCVDRSHSALARRWDRRIRTAHVRVADAGKTGRGAA